MSKININITNDALNYLNNIINLENDKNIIIYLSVIYPFTQYAHVNISYCKKNNLNFNDIKLNIKNLNIYIAHKSINALKDAIIDFKKKQLIINAPNIYIKDNKNLKKQLKHLFENEINVILSQHGGSIELVNINNDTITIKFHGGCQGCGMVGYTLNNYIEKIIKKHFPTIKKINDITSHEIKNNSYY